jgi:hypothetical protein
MDRVKMNRCLLPCLVALAILVTWLVTPQVFAASVTLNWDANAEPELSGYKVHVGVASRVYSTHIDAGKVIARTVDNLAAGTKYFFAVTAYDGFGNESGYSNEVTATTPTIGVETISTPLRPVGPSTGLTGVSYTYSAGGAASSTGDAVQYRFSWSDGSVSSWLPAGTTSASKAWSAPGTYTLVRVEARCSLHTTIVSAPSPALTVTIAAAPLETVSAPAAPSGPTSGVVGRAYTYTTGGSVSSSGHSVEYRFSWSDGTVSAWLPAASASAAKTWGAPGTYTLVRSEARCALHPSIVSAVSRSITVTITSGVAESVSKPTSPAGPAGGYTSAMYVFSTGGSVSSAGDPVVYRFHWGDGTTSEWVGPGQPVSAGKSWGVPGTYLVQAEAACTLHPTVGSFSSSIEVTITEKSLAPPASYVLWTRGDTGQAILWKVDPSAMPGTISVTSWAHLDTPSGVGGPWQASSYTSVDASTGYVLWTRGDTGQAILWKVDPSTMPGTIPVTSWAYLSTPTGVGGPWQATSYTHVDASTGYVLWTRSDTGQAILWKIDPSAMPGTIPVTSWAHLNAPTGVGGPWQATSYTHLDASTGYVLWTRSDTGQAVLWKVDPSAMPGTIPVLSSASLYAPSGVGGPWQATSYEHLDASTGYVLWTRSDTGQAILWQVDPSVAVTIPLAKWAFLDSSTGVGAPWKATGFAY